MMKAVIRMITKDRSPQMLYFLLHTNVRNWTDHSNQMMRSQLVP